MLDLEFKLDPNLFKITDKVCLMCGKEYRGFRDVCDSGYCYQAFLFRRAELSVGHYDNRARKTIILSELEKL